MGYRVVKYFTDLQDHNHPYHAGDAYPREGVSVSEARLAELASAENKRGVVLIERDELEQSEEFFAMPAPEPEPEVVPKRRGRKPKHEAE